MATPSTREQLKDYALRALGQPVIEINVDNDQLEDRLDEAMQYYSQFHMNAIKRCYLKYEYTQADYDRIVTNGDVSESITKNSVTTGFGRVLFFRRYHHHHHHHGAISLYRSIDLVD